MGFAIVGNYNYDYIFMLPFFLEKNHFAALTG
jgi:hypothetical protein